MPTFNDDTLAAAKSGDKTAIASLVRAWHRPLRGFVATMILNSQDVDDVAQEVFLRAMERIDRVPDTRALGGFLRGIARNVIRERQRKFAREGRAYIGFAAEHCETAAAHQQASWLADPELLTALRACLASLPDKSRQMLSLRYDKELNSDQIGEQIGMNAPAVRAAMRRARQALLRCIRSNYGPAIGMP